jgi:hypothetical protein
MLTAPEWNFPPFQLTEGNTGRYVQVPQLNCKEPFRTLGTHKTILGGQSEQIRILQVKSDNFGKGILSSSATAFEARTGYSTIWYPSCNYLLAAIFLSRKTCKKIQSFATCATLIKCGFNHHYPRAVLFGSPRYGGLGWCYM